MSYSSVREKNVWIVQYLIDFMFFINWKVHSDYTIIYNMIFSQSVITIMLLLSTQIRTELSKGGRKSYSIWNTLYMNVVKCRILILGKRDQAVAINQNLSCDLKALYKIDGM